VRLPAVTAVGEKLPPVPEVPAPLELPEGRRTYSEIRYAERGGAGFVWFGFPDGAMSTVQCRRLLAAYRYACTRPTRVVVLGAARGVFSNGIHLGVVDAAPDPAAEARTNAQALRDVVEAVRATTDRWVVAAVGGDVAGGGVALMCAGDEVWCRAGAVLRPYTDAPVPGLPAPECTEDLLRHRLGPRSADAVLRDPRPLSTAAARRLGLTDHIVLSPPDAFASQVTERAAALASDPSLAQHLTRKRTFRVPPAADAPADAPTDTAVPR
jgi:putative two-component system hydrogenase maturation factor HypX/HoxX